jgi:hypothetical protein
VRCTGTGSRAHPLTRLPKQRPGLGGAEKQDADPPGGGLRALGRPGGSQTAGLALCAAASVHQPFSAVVQAQKQRTGGGRIKRLHHPPRTTLQQLLRTGLLSDQEAQGLRELRKRCDPVALLATMRSCQSRLVLLISGQRDSAMAGDLLSWASPEEEKRELEGFLEGLQALWRQSRPPQKKPKPRQGRCSRLDPFEAHADLVPQWLEAERDGAARSSHTG